MQRNPTPHTWMHRNHHLSSKCTRILPITYECTDIVIPQVNAPISYPSHINTPNSSSLQYMHRNLTPHTWMHRNHHPSGKCTGLLTLTHECTEIVIPQVSAQESYAWHMNAPKSSLLKLMHQIVSPYTWMHRNRQSSGKCTDILSLTHGWTEIIIPQVNAPKSFPSHMNAPKS